MKWVQLWLLLGIASAVVQISADQRDCHAWTDPYKTSLDIIFGPTILLLGLTSTHHCAMAKTD